MRQLLTILACTLFMTACAQKQQATSQENGQTTVKWIADKPGATMQPHSLYPSVPDTLWVSLGLADGVPTSMSCVLMRTGGRNILIDTGLGAPFSQLRRELQAEGLESGDIDIILLTHLHNDHIGGMMAGGKPVFTNATVYINRLEAEAWLAMDNTKNESQRAMMEAYKSRLRLFEGGDSVEGGIKTIPAYGHTPGHTMFQKDNILIIGDLIHGAPLQVRYPEHCAKYDMDKEKAVAVRRQTLDYARRQRFEVYGMHIPAPGRLTLR
ncbi:MAG: MBL fold metallo-hydrolase [Prevotella sp.]